MEEMKGNTISLPNTTTNISNEKLVMPTSPPRRTLL